MDTATLSLRRILESGEYERLEAVPVFDEHEVPISEEEAELAPLFVRRKDGKPYRVYDRKAIETIAANTNERAERSGDLGPVGPGHTIPDQYDGNRVLVRKIPETEQPPPWGFAANYRWGTYGPDERPGLLCDWFIRREHADKVKNDFPRRSIELWKDRMVIDWTALLRRAPKRDLGLLAVNQRHDPRLCERYEMDGDPTAVPPDAEEPSPEESVELQKMAKKLWSYFEPMVKACMSAPQPTPPVAAAPPGAPPGAPPAAPPAAPPPPAAVPPPGGPPKGPPEKKEESEQMQADDRERLARFERDLADVKKSNEALRADNDALRKSGRDAARRAKLVELHGQGFAVNLDKELKRVEHFSDEQFRDHCLVIVENYARDPSHYPLIPVADDVGPAGGGSSNPDIITDRHQKAALRHMQEQHARGHECNFDEAVEATRGKA